MTRFLLMLILAFGATAGAPAMRLATPATMTIDNVVRGGQAEIDAGNVVLMYNTCWPDQGCPVWLAGHRSTHGSVFAQVADLQPGQVVSVLGYRFVVTTHTVVCCYGTPFTATADLTLQTSASNRQLHIVTANRLP